MRLPIALMFVVALCGWAFSVYDRNEIVAMDWLIILVLCVTRSEA